MSATQRRRSSGPVDVLEDAGAFVVRLGGEAALTPAGARLAAPTRALAELLAAERGGEGPPPSLAAMPMTRLALVAIDALPARRGAAVDEIVEYAGADLLCYFAEAPGSLVETQRRLWSPILAWAGEDLNLVFQATSGIVHRPQPAATLASVRGIASSSSDFVLAALAFGAPLFGSTILTLALWAGRVGAGEAVAAAMVDETFQQERWGLDAEAAGRARRLAEDAAVLEAWFRALR